MKLIKAKIQDFRSIEDTGEFEINDLTCLVGKKAGKTAILQALEAQRPYSKGSSEYDVTKDYPRRFVTQYEQRHPKGEAVVCTTIWELSDEDKASLSEKFGDAFVSESTVKIQSGYGIEGTRWSLNVDEKKAIEFLLSKFKLDPLALYETEWEILGKGKNRNIYWPFSHIELLVPWIFIAIYTILMIGILFWHTLLH